MCVFFAIVPFVVDYTYSPEIALPHRLIGSSNLRTYVHKWLVQTVHYYIKYTFVYLNKV